MAYQLWIEEEDKAVWHAARERMTDLQYRAACGWMVSIRHARLWPQKRGEIGPAQANRCHACGANTDP